MISVSALGLLLYVALGCTVLIPVLLGILLIVDFKRGKIW